MILSFNARVLVTLNIMAGAFIACGNHQDSNQPLNPDTTQEHSTATLEGDLGSCQNTNGCTQYSYKSTRGELGLPDVKALISDLCNHSHYRPTENCAIPNPVAYCSIHFKFKTKGILLNSVQMLDKVRDFRFVQLFCEKQGGIFSTLPPA